MQPFMSPQVPELLAMLSLAAFTLTLALILWQAQPKPSRRRMAVALLFVLVLVGARLYAQDGGQPVLGPCYHCRGLGSGDVTYWLFGCWSC